jgi:hypothetical protein
MWLAAFKHEFSNPPLATRSAAFFLAHTPYFDIFLRGVEMDLRPTSLLAHQAGFFGLLNRLL